MGKNIEKLYDLFALEPSVFLNFYKSKFPVIHNSNIFRSDFHYAVAGFYAEKGHPLSYSDIEKLLPKIANFFEDSSVISKVDGSTWKVNQLQFATGSPHVYEVTSTNQNPA